jgi:hypothetical protein
MAESPIIAFAQFFDDIRMEINGKAILIGQYAGDLILQAGFPVFVDRLAILLTVKWPRDYMPNGLSIEINIPGQPKINQPLDNPPSMDFSHRPLSDFSGVMLQWVIQLRFAPLRAGDIIDVWFKADGRELPAGRLFVTDKIPSRTEKAGTFAPGEMVVTVF